MAPNHCFARDYRLTADVRVIPQKACPICDTAVLLKRRDCPTCGYEWGRVTPDVSTEPYPEDDKDTERLAAYAA